MRFTEHILKLIESLGLKYCHNERKIIYSLHRTKCIIYACKKWSTTKNDENQ